MRTYDEILEGLCQQHYGMSFVECCEKIVYKGLKAIARHAAHEYAREAIVEHLGRAAETAKVHVYHTSYGVKTGEVNKDSIRNIEIILK